MPEMFGSDVLASRIKYRSILKSSKKQKKAATKNWLTESNGMRNHGTTHIRTSTSKSKQVSQLKFAPHSLVAIEEEK